MAILHRNSEIFRRATPISQMKGENDIFTMKLNSALSSKLPEASNVFPLVGLWAWFLIEILP
jgi:hypothetical protein